MNTTTPILPNKWIRKAIYDLVDGITVDGNIIDVYDTRIPQDVDDHYILMTTQTNLVNKANMQEYRWLSSINLDIVTTYPKYGNPGSRLLLNNITEEVRDLLEDFTLDVASGLSVLHQTFSTPTEFYDQSEAQNIFRCVVRLDLEIE